LVQYTRMKMDAEFDKTKESVRRELANFLGVDTEDIEDDSSLTEDLHMKATDLADFMEILTRMDMDTEGVDLTETETFLELVEALTEHQ
jgi:acyl carrier protein